MASLADKLGVGQTGLVAFVGAGGKSSLLLGLGAELVAAGRRVVLSTTTKMGADQIPRWATVCRTVTEVLDALEGSNPAFLVGDISGAKVTGVTPELVDRLSAMTEIDHVLVEADGARGRSLKVPAPHEPVIPSATKRVVIVAGIDAVGRTIGDATHRPERVAAFLGRTLDDPLRPADLARVLADPKGGHSRVPAEARVTVALTKVTPGPAADAAARVVELLEETQIDRVTLIESPPDAAIGLDRSHLIPGP